MLTIDTIVQANPEQISSGLANETIILDLTQNTYFGLNEIGTQIWQLIQTPTSVTAVLDQLLREYEVERDVCLDHTLGFLQDLHQKGLLVVCDVSSS